ncbi:hypothetical protein [Rhizobium gallicum]|uniref:hypothetical protein n=1 Tax=Rhizobium gallicum TaxID=56730 RepID=UPI001EF790D2|nr:hypothetical protein [Rhizobium gallicum]ULJ74179.1 hypothetical protein L2W42_07690 [Rhizobium gallicum]
MRTPRINGLSSPISRDGTAARTCSIVIPMGELADRVPEAMVVVDHADQPVPIDPYDEPGAVLEQVESVELRGFDE